MINKKIIDGIKEKTGKSQPRVYKIITDRKSQFHNSISVETAANLVAAEVGVNVAKFLSQEELSEIRSLMNQKVEGDAIKITKKSVKTKVVNIGDDIKLKDPKLPHNILADAEKMAKVYPILYLFENSMRSVVIEIMKSEYGEKWWQQVNPKIIKKVEGRIKEEKDKRWHGKRGSHEIYYTDMDELRSIIISKNHWELFKDRLYKQSWLEHMMDVITTSRNIIAHNNPLNDDDIKRIHVSFKDWIKQVR